MRKADPNMSFTLAWNRLMKQKPGMFDFNKPKPAKSHVALPHILGVSRLPYLHPHSPATIKCVKSGKVEVQGGFPGSPIKSR